MRAVNDDFVLDASIALGWCFKDESDALTQQLLERLWVDTGHVPELWALEVGNVLVGAEKRGRISYADMSQFVALIQLLNIKMDRETSDRCFNEIMPLAYSSGLTSYDASYLELALRKGAPLATKDVSLQKAAEKLGVEILR